MCADHVQIWLVAVRDRVRALDLVATGALMSQHSPSVGNDEALAAAVAYLGIWRGSGSHPVWYRRRLLFLTLTVGFSSSSSCP